MSELNPARALAVRVMSTVREREAFTAEILDPRLRDAHLKHEDAAFCRMLCLGVTATRGTLDEFIDRCMNTPDDIRCDVRDALRISAYEMLFLEKADHAAVDQGVELVRFVQPKAVRLANAVLRKMAKAKEEFPFGDPATDDAAMARLFGFPLWIAQLLVSSLGRTQAIEFMRVSNTQAPVYFGVNALRSSDQNVLKAFEEAGHALKPVVLPGTAIPIEGCFKADSPQAVAEPIAKKLFAAGAILVSDAAAQCVASSAIPVRKPSSFLEVGSGRGTKTLLLQSNARRRYGSQMKLSALDSHGFKGDLLLDRTKRYNVDVAETICADARDLHDSLGSRTYGAAFIDAPCSGLGTLRRHPELRWRLQESDIEAMAQLGLEMLIGTAAHVSVGGRLTYATCTVTARENEYVVKAFLESRMGSNFKIVPTPAGPASKLFCKTTLTDGGCDAHFAASLQRVR